MSTTSTTPWWSRESPIGTCVAAAFRCSFARSASITESGSAPSRSSLLMKAIRGTVVALHLAINGDRLRLHAGDAAQHEDGAIEHAQRALHLNREVDVAGRVDDVDLVSPQLQYVAADWMVMPFSRSRSMESILAPTPSLPRTS